MNATDRDARGTQKLWLPDPAAYAFGRALRKFSSTTRRVANRLDRVSRRYLVSGQPARGAVSGSGGMIWFHSIDLGQGEITGGVKSVEELEAEAIALNLPDSLSGQSVLDIGAWDGYFSFEMERRGASVTALDHYAWSVDHIRYQHYHTAALAAGEPLVPPEEAPGVWDPVNLPGRAGFDRARAALGSKVQPVLADFMTMDLSTLGRFDVVLFLGVLYHLKDPFLALRRLRQLTAGTAVIESATVLIPGWTDERLWMFLEGPELNVDPSNWWAPTPTGLAAMCRAAGFSAVRIIAQPLEYAAPGPGYHLHYGRIVVHAYA